MKPTVQEPSVITKLVTIGGSDKVCITKDIAGILDFTIFSIFHISTGRFEKHYHRPNRQGMSHIRNAKRH